MTNGHTPRTLQLEDIACTHMCSSECNLEPPGRVALEEQEPFQNDSVIEHDELEDLGLPEITKERIKLQRSLFEEKHRMYMFEKNYLPLPHLPF